MNEKAKARKTYEVKLQEKKTENSEFKKPLALPHEVCYYNQAVRKQRL